MAEPRKFARAADFGRERVFPELGVAVLVEKSRATGSEIIVFVRELAPGERAARTAGLTRRRKRV